MTNSVEDIPTQADRIERIDAALSELIAANDGAWPTVEQFRAFDGLKLYGQLAQEGIPFWRKRHGVERKRQRPRARRKPVAGQVNDTIAKEVDRVLAELSEANGGYWPTMQEFRVAGHAALYAKMSRGGGISAWKARSGLPVQGAQAPDRVEQRRGRIDEILTKLIEENDGHWPGVEQFRDAGLVGLYSQMSSTEGIPFWRKRHGLAKPRRARRVHMSPTERKTAREQRRLDRLDAVLSEVAKDGKWPTVQQFAQAGKMSAYVQMSTGEGVAYWQERSGLAAPERVPSPLSKPTPSATTEERLERAKAVRAVRIENDLSEITDDPDYFPTAREFARAGKAGTYALIQRHEGVEWWAEKLGRREGRDND